LRAWPGANLKLLAPLPSAGSLLVLLALAILLARGDWRLAAGIVAVALILFSSLIAPHYLGLFALLAFMGTAMPIINQGGALNRYRWAMLLAMALGLVVRNSMQGSSSRWHPMHFSLALFVFCAAISSSYSVNGLMTLLKAGTFGCLFVGAMLYGRLESRHGSESPCKLLEHLYWCGALVGLGCVLAELHVLPSGPGYFRGPFGNANALGAFIPFIAPVLLLKSFQPLKKGPLTRAANVALTAMFLVFLLMSRSRGGIVATFVACGWWLYFTSRKVFGWFVVGALLSGAISLVYFPRYIESVNRVYVQKGTSYVLQTRGKILEATWEAAMENPLHGVGFGVAKGYSEDWEFGFETAGAGREKMNSFLAAIEEVGIVGAAFLLLPLAWVFVAAARRLILIRKFYPSAGEFWTVLTLSACLLGGLADSLAEAWLTAAGFFSAIMFWLIFGVLATRLTIPFRAPQ
jgi:O-antigen ligase